MDALRLVRDPGRDRRAYRDGGVRRVGPSEAETFWTDFLRKLRRRGLRGVKLVISDAHEGTRPPSPS